MVQGNFLMSDKPEKVEMYKCAITGKLFTTEKAAKASAAKALKVAAKCKELEEKTAKIEQNREYKKNNRGKKNEGK